MSAPTSTACAMVAVVLCGLTAVAQPSLQALSDRMRSALEVRQTEFVLEHVVVSNDRVAQRWSHGLERAFVSVIPKTTHQSAMESLNRVPMAMSTGDQPVDVPATLGAVGFMFPRHGRDGTTTIYCVKGVYFVMVSAPSEGITVSLAHAVVGVLP